MMSLKRWLFLLVVCISPSLASAAVKTRVVEYREGTTVLEGFLAFDDSKTGKQAGILVVHAWMGLDEYAKKRTIQLAESGYVAFAADIYGKGVRAKTPDEAGKLAGAMRSNRPLLRARARAAFDTLAAQPTVDPKRIAAIGYCFGGGTVLELARSGAPVLGVVSFHGNLDTPNVADAKNIKGKVLVLHGAEDPYVPAESIVGFMSEMKNANVDWQMVSYGGAVHSFTIPDAGNDKSKGAAYHAVADARSWRMMKDFLGEVLR